MSLNGFSCTVERKAPRYRSLFCSLLWPRHPGRFGGEIRDFHLLRHLLSISTVEFFSLHPVTNDGRDDFLATYLEALHTSDSIHSTRPDLVHPMEANRNMASRLIRTLRQRRLPVVGTRYHWDPSEHLPLVLSSCGPALQERLKSARFDFLFVGPQVNPVALTFDTTQFQTRLIMSSYDIEAVRIRSFANSERGLSRLALRLEARRAARFERDNLARYDGVIAVSEQDRQYFIAQYGFAAERVLTLDNGVDPQYFTFSPRIHGDRPHIVFVGTLSYLPNRQAAWRLIRTIMPLVRRKFPDACLWIVGQQPEESLRAQSDGFRTVVTGAVEDVRPYLTRATVSCVPLISGSGTKYKVLEALSAGVPMVCTPLAIDGLGLEDGRHLLVGRSDEEVATAINNLIGDEQRAASLARQGREEVEGRFAWPQTLSRLNDWLSVMNSLPRR
jgi:glycosyltransferase involved in cell wall biosynthesis